VQTLPSSQTGGVPGVHAPAWQVSPPLHASPSLHEPPSAIGVCAQPSTGSQVSAVQGSKSSQGSEQTGEETLYVHDADSSPNVEAQIVTVPPAGPAVHEHSDPSPQKSSFSQAHAPETTR
jgi:hypothetical protein